MVSTVKNGKGFKILSIGRNELRQAIGGRGVCDYCSEKPIEGYYIAVLNSWYCPKCYHEWITINTYDEEDRPFEERNYQHMTEMLDKCKQL